MFDNDVFALIYKLLNLDLCLNRAISELFNYIPLFVVAKLDSLKSLV